VIAIISLLSSVVLAALRDARDKAKQTAWKQYMTEVVKTIELYKSDNSGNYPPFGSLKVQIQGTSVLSTYINWMEPPNFVEEDSLEFYDSANAYGTVCGENNVGLFLTFISTREDLNFSKVLDPSDYYNPYNIGVGNIWYCLEIY
jgi:type II secretory pathway pseudopilin PulG